MPERPTTYYAGRRALGVGGLAALNLEVHAVDRAGLRPLEHAHRWSHAPFDWGGGRDGAVELAYALVLDLTGMFGSLELCDELARDVLRDLPLQGFVLADTDLLAWLDVRAP